MKGRNYKLHRERASLAWPILVGRANDIKEGRLTNKDTFTYKDLGEAIEVHYRAVSYALSEIQRYCHDNGLPALQALVVSGTGPNKGLPGAGYDGSSRTLEAHKFELQKICTHPWSSLSPDFG